mgnify:FL=1
MNIEKYLVLNKYLLSLFGIEDFKEIQSKLKDVPSDVDIEGRTRFINTLRSSFSGLKIPEDLLLGYDANIQSYVSKINRRREPVHLKYFQYLAILFTEIFFDNLKNRKGEFLYNLNEFISKYKREHDINTISDFTEEDLNKLAFWMATGSGKTLIMHINYLQFLHYNPFSPDNIILITPNEGLSKQHFEELQKSDIPCTLYSGSLNGGLKFDNEVLILEITKLVEEKRGGGVSLPVDVFEGKNLVFVDEGHKGKKSEEQKWAKLRNRLAKNGFVFEYSATFGQILDEKNKELLEEYAKSIILDYSYKYFYLDGYGKDFTVLNVKEVNVGNEKFQEIMFVANLLSYYEQLLFYEENRRLAKEYNIEKPLWIFVGASVTGKEEESDVLQILDFIKRVVQDEDWLKEVTKDIMEGRTGLKDEKDKDVFSEKFRYLREKGIDFEDLYKRVFGGKGSLNVYELKNATGELGLKISENEYFGVVNIGDVTGFKKQLEKKNIPVNDDVISSSLFDDIKRENSRINILIGSRKFIEGWDTWRVSSMGLLNMGRGEGPQIIQLFGRGVRLKGKDMSLKRSGDNSSIRILETLNIYSIKADYLSKFLEAIRKEEVEFETIEIPIKKQHQDKWESLRIPFPDESKHFEEDKVLRLEIDETILSKLKIDIRPKVSIYETEKREEGITAKELDTTFKEEGLQKFIDLFDWERIFQEVYEFKKLRGYWNLTLDMGILRNLTSSEKYKIYATREVFEIKTQEDIKRLEDITILLLKKYIDLFYKKYAKIFETEYIQPKTIKQLSLPIISEDSPKYILQVEKKERELIKKIKDLVSNLNELYKDGEDPIPRICLDRHLFIPVLLHSNRIDKISPVGLVESEKNFISGLKEYLEGKKGKDLDSDIFLLRNTPLSGVGFQLKWAGFYPDFIMWIKNKEREIIVFIDPKGLEHTKDLDNEKIVFAGFKGKDSETLTIKDIESQLGIKGLVLESFILSDTKYSDLVKGRTSPPSKEEYIKHHVLFLEDEDWPEMLFKHLGIVQGIK